MTEIVERLERQAVNVENDGHVSAARAMREAATALSEARAEIEEWRQAASVEAGLRREFFTRAEKAESELSTLRARVREVVGPLARLTVPEKPQGNAGAYSIFHNDIRAARQLNEDLK